MFECGISYSRVRSNAVCFFSGQLCPVQHGILKRSHPIVTRYSLHIMTISDWVTLVYFVHFIRQFVNILDWTFLTYRVTVMLVLFKLHGFYCIYSCLVSVSLGRKNKTKTPCFPHEIVLSDKKWLIIYLNNIVIFKMVLYCNLYSTWLCIYDIIVFVLFNGKETELQNYTYLYLSFLFRKGKVIKNWQLMRICCRNVQF